jgi:hypothetical protein
MRQPAICVGADTPTPYSQICEGLLREDSDLRPLVFKEHGAAAIFGGEMILSPIDH